eukprot:UN26446
MKNLGNYDGPQSSLHRSKSFKTDFPKILRDLLRKIREITKIYIFGIVLLRRRCTQMSASTVLPTDLCKKLGEDAHFVCQCSVRLVF